MFSFAFEELSFSQTIHYSPNRLFLNKMFGRVLTKFVVILAFTRSYYSFKSQHIGDCSNWDNKLTLICNGYTPLDDFSKRGVILLCKKNGVHVFTDSISKVNFKDCDQPKIPEDIFEAYENSHTLNISDVGMTQNEVAFLQKAVTLKFVNASNNKIERISDEMFGKSENLSIIDLSFNEITHFDSDAFPVKNNVTILNLSHNNISEVTVKSFERLTNVDKLTLSNNQITEIKSFSFHKTEELTELDLSFNEIRKIYDYALSGDMNLRNLNLSNNKIPKLTKKMFGNFPNLKYLDVASNEIASVTSDTFEYFRNLLHLDFSKNSMEKFDDRTFVRLEKIQYLNLAHNKLTVIERGTFSAMNDLQTLDLTGNVLKKLNVDIIPLHPIQLKLFSIGHNQLREFVGFKSSNMPNAKIVGIDTNQLNCSHIDEILENFAWKHFDSFSEGIKCSSSNEENPETSTSSIRKITEKIATTQTTTQSQIYSDSEEEYIDKQHAKTNKEQNEERTIIIKMTWSEIQYFAVVVVVVIISIIIIVIIIKKCKQRIRDSRRPIQIINHNDPFDSLIAMRIFKRNLNS